ncbi:MAG TPA: hypothetical protein PLR44_00220 [Thermomicrobiales bacterium]|nr:hypothetical protein [Thermomicrobiales bacterium]HRA30401.1 hypothetical protein [Thermomicrobiales bacterium]
MIKLMRWMRGTTLEKEGTPICPDHGVEMTLFKNVGKPTRFSDQSTQTYTLLYRCPVPGCDHTAERDRVRNQIPVRGEQTTRPVWSKQDRTRV